MQSAQPAPQDLPPTVTSQASEAGTAAPSPPTPAGEKEGDGHELERAAAAITSIAHLSSALAQDLLYQLGRGADGAPHEALVASHSIAAMIREMEALTLAVALISGRSRATRSDAVAALHPRARLPLTAADFAEAERLTVTRALSHQAARLIAGLREGAGRGSLPVPARDIEAVKPQARPLPLPPHPASPPEEAARTVQAPDVAVPAAFSQA